MGNEGMDVKKVETQEKDPKGTAVNMETGTAKVPHGTSVREEAARPQRILLEDTPNNREALARLFAKNGFHYEAAELRGKPYEETFVNSAKNLIAENTSVLKGLVIVAIGAFTYYVSKKAIQALSKRMGWNLFGPVPVSVVDTTVAPFDGGKTVPVRRIDRPTQNIATA